MKFNISIDFSSDKDMNLFSQIIGYDMRSSAHFNFTKNMELGSKEFNIFAQMKDEFSPFILRALTQFTAKELSLIEVFRLNARKTLTSSYKLSLEMEKWINSYPRDKDYGIALPEFRWIWGTKKIETIANTDSFHSYITTTKGYDELKTIYRDDLNHIPLKDFKTGEKITDKYVISASLLPDNCVHDISVRYPSNPDRICWRDIFSLTNECIQSMKTIAFAKEPIDIWGQRFLVSKADKINELKKIQPKGWQYMPILNKNSDLYKKYLDNWNFVSDIVQNHKGSKLF